MRTIGVLECDHADERHRPIAGDSVDMLRTLFGRHTPGLELVPIDVVGGAPLPPVDAHDGWIVPGSRYSVYDDLGWIGELSGFVRAVADAGAPFVGICFGHQLLAHALGGRVERAAVGWGAGVRRIEVTGSAGWMAPRAGSVALNFMHQDQITVLPPGGVVVGAAPHCPAAMLQVGERMVGVQAHPEFGAPYMDALLADRVARIGDDEVAAARAGLSAPTDEGIVARWLHRVLTSVPE